MLHDFHNQITPLKYRYILAFGSNLGPKQKQIELGLKEVLKENQLVGCSRFISTTPLKSQLYDTKNHENYCNMVCDIQSKLNPLELYKKIVLVEDKIGHNRTGKWLPRKLDIDLLLWAKNFYNDFNFCPPLFFKADSFQVPHNEFSKRDFLLDLCKDLKITRKCLKKHRIL